jgi:hypothetical protein
MEKSPETLFSSNPTEFWTSKRWLYVQVTVHRDKLRINNQLAASNIQNLFCHEILHVSDIFCAHHQELSAVHLAVGMFHAGYVAAS